MKEYFIETEISVKVKIVEDDNIYRCEMIPNTLSNTLTLQACENALADYDDEATFEYFDTISDCHLFEKVSCE